MEEIRTPEDGLAGNARLEVQRGKERRRHGGAGGAVRVWGGQGAPRGRATGVWGEAGGSKGSHAAFEKRVSQGAPPPARHPRPRWIPDGRSPRGRIPGKLHVATSRRRGGKRRPRKKTLERGRGWGRGRGERHTSKANGGRFRGNDGSRRRQKSLFKVLKVSAGLGVYP